MQRKRTAVEDESTGNEMWQVVGDTSAAPCYTRHVPTTRPRHTITETPPVQAALDELRAKLGEDERIDFAELVALGAEVKARRVATEDSAAATARRRLAEMVRTGSFRYAVDVKAGDQAKRLGLIPNYDA
jgi:hypothetical protein